MTYALVTGGTGFIGGHLVDTLLERGERVRCLVRGGTNTQRLESLGVEILRGSLTDPDAAARAVDGVQVVYHLAGRTQALRWADLMDTNVRGTAVIARACANCSTPPVLVYASSVAAAGPARPGRLRLPSDRPHPISDYGRSKRGGELAIEQLARELPATIVRPGVVFGPGGRQLLPVFQMIFRGRVHFVPLYVPPPLSIIDVRDLVDILIRAAERGRRVQPRSGEENVLSDGYYFAAVDETPNWKELGKMIAEEGGVRWMVPFHLPDPAPWLIAAGSELAVRIARVHSDLTIDKIREATVPSWACSCQTTREQLGFCPPYSLRERLRQTIEWYRAAGNL